MTPRTVTLAALLLVLPHTQAFRAGRRAALRMSASEAEGNRMRGERALKATAVDILTPLTEEAEATRGLPKDTDDEAWASMESLEPSGGVREEHIARMHTVADGVARALSFDMPNYESPAAATEEAKAADVTIPAARGFPSMDDEEAWASMDCLEQGERVETDDDDAIPTLVNEVSRAVDFELPLMRQSTAERKLRANKLPTTVDFRGRLVGETTCHEIKNKAALGIPDHVDIFVKCEYENPTGSIKDRIAKYMLETALKRGDLTKDMTIVEASSGNTGASVALIAQDLGVPCVIVTSEVTSKEKVGIIASFGAEVVICKSAPADSPAHYQNTADSMYRERLPNAYTLDQYNNPLNADAYYYSLGPEIAEEVPGVDYVVAGSSTGGTLAGTGRFLKEKKGAKVVLSDPIGSVLANYVETGVVEPYRSQAIEGVGKDSIPGNFDRELIDMVQPVVDKDAIRTCHRLLKHENLFVGGSSGLNVCAAIQLAQSLEKPADGSTVKIVTVAPDGGFKYLSKYYNKEWLAEKGITN